MRGVPCAVADDLGVVAHKAAQARTALVHDSRINPVDWRCSACQHSKVADPEALEGIRLSRHHPRICSEADVTHGWWKAACRESPAPPAAAVAWESPLYGTSADFQDAPEPFRRARQRVAVAFYRCGLARASAARICRGGRQAWMRGGRRCFGRGFSPARRAYPVTAISRDVLLLRPVCVERPHVISAVNYAHWRVNAATERLQYQVCACAFIASPGASRAPAHLQCQRQFQ